MCYSDKFCKPVKLYRGENAAYKFIEEMFSEEVNCAEMMKTHFNKTIIMTEPDKLDFANAKYCHICNVKYKPNVKEDIVKDHDRYTGKYKGSAHKTCQSKVYYDRSLNVFFHNLKGYDSHFLLQEIGKFKKI